MADLLSRTRGAERPPTAEERLLDLVELHTARPGITEATLGECTTADGRTGYEVLAAQVPEGARAVLDLGCGNGPLLAAVARARPLVTRLAGIDLCASDLALARTRLPEGLADLRCEPAQKLSFEDASMDAVLSHHAFYLFDPMETAMAEVARVLRPGGLFSLVTWSFTAERIELFANLMNVSSALTRRDNPHFTGWADRRNFQRAVFEGMLEAAGFAPPLAVTEHTLELCEPAGPMIERLMGFFYSADLQSEATRAEQRAEWARLLDATRSTDGLARLSFPFSVTRIHKAG
jgi:SAM-dependent methyltransferase